jgi:SLT domain-containing protein
VHLGGQLTKERTKRTGENRREQKKTEEGSRKQTGNRDKSKNISITTLYQVPASEASITTYRVGANTMPIVPSLRDTRTASSSSPLPMLDSTWAMGNRYVTVLPDPVSERTFEERKKSRRM